MKRTRIFLAAIVLVFFAAAFLLFHFRAMSSKTSVESGVASARNGDPKAPWSLSPQVTGLYVEGRGQLAETLLAQVKRQLKNQQHIGDITDMNAPVDRADIPQLYIQVVPISHFWTPFYARSEYQLVVSYASNGDISFRQQKSPRFMATGGQPVLQYKASQTIKDTSLGLFSAPGYQDYLAGKMARLILDNFQKQTQ